MKLPLFSKSSIRLAAVVAIAVLGLCLLVWFSGCEVKVNEDWTGFGAEASYHPFSEPFVTNHITYLEDHLDHPDPLADCRVCHGEDYSGGTSGKSCLNEGCHTLPGGPEACGTCHGIPPTEDHPASDLCYLCHGQVIDANQNIINDSLHIDGIVEVQIEGNHPFGPPYVANHTGYLRIQLFPLEVCQACHGDDYSGGVSDVSCLTCHTFAGGPEACNTCHGNFLGDPSEPANQAPPLDVARNTTTDSIGVGAHQTHLLGGIYTDGIVCSSCHVIPDAWDSPGHIESGPAELDFSGLSVEGEADPMWDRQSQDCSDTYCHRPGVPIWTIVDGTQAACGDCHTIPPPSPHPNATLDECYNCHSRVINETGTIIDTHLHLDGTVEFN
jgi:predicted CxxxxCH...CXXCH cytochrome family protein